MTRLSEEDDLLESWCEDVCKRRGRGSLAEPR